MALSERRSRFFHLRRPGVAQSESSSQPEQQQQQQQQQRPVTSTAPLQPPKSSSSATEQAAELLKITNHIRTQLHEVQRLRRLRAPLLDPAESNWIDATISDIAHAAHDVAVLLEPTRIEQETRNGKLTLGRQLRWKYRESQRAMNKSQRLLACHHSLIGVLSHLQRIDLSQPTPSRMYELEAGLTSNAVLEPCELEVVLDAPAWGKVVGSDADEPECVVEWPGKQKTMVSSATKQDSVRANTPAADSNNVDLSAMDCEMNDLLEWRRSRGPMVDTKRSVVHLSRGV
ncbi:hypothetical protein BDV26DRAFT_101925 [Aspergillus bertholletiae]|uniref:Uncharacterized protein n=1 Tax=Aspergillus bertholletiae TaxID=1226010 RepID=A0A5N7BHH5_9EURO|nr:hypothetical protein BDV26DRAFT_101925 [Aspergillus bertholletiae]